MILTGDSETAEELSESAKGSYSWSLEALSSCYALSLLGVVIALSLESSS